MRHIPDHATCVFEGVLFAVYQWEQELFDGTTTTFEALKRAPMADVIVRTPEDQILVLEERQPGTDWFPSLPGGHIEIGEDPLLGVQRELLEETGYAADRWQLLETFPCGGKVYSPMYVYGAAGIRLEQPPAVEGGEQIRVRAVDFDAFLQLCRDVRFNAPMGLKMLMYEALLEPRIRQDLRERIFAI